MATSRNVVPLGKSRPTPPTPPPPPPSPARAGSTALRGQAQASRTASPPTWQETLTQQRALINPNLTPSQQAYGATGVPQASQTNAALQARLGRTPALGGGGGVGSGETARTPQYGDFGMDYRDPEYNAQIAALQRALQDFETGAQQRSERYGIDYLQGVRNIGYRPDPSFVAMPNVLEMARQSPAPRAITGAESDQVQIPAGEWDYEGRFNPFSAAARGTRGTRDEFAGRGTLRSSDFAQNYGQFQNRLLEQLGAMETGRTRFTEDTVQEIAARRAGTAEQTQAAQRAASARAAQAQQEAYLRALGR